mmetsp:Transcript_12503/g.17467  ORF Transcript_12503/g.17467 Transcript_12503/m.17467 type:complete len:179 (+) Transcript_12503:1426-1962(+)
MFKCSFAVDILAIRLNHKHPAAVREQFTRFIPSVFEQTTGQTLSYLHTTKSKVIRGLALGTLNEKTQNQFLQREFKMALALSAVLSTAGFLRASAFRTPFAETVAITSALCMIVFSSICLGAVLPLLLKRIGVDPAHSSTTIQVIMDILGVLLTVFVSTTILDSPFGQLLISRLSFGS